MMDIKETGDSNNSKVLKEQFNNIEEDEFYSNAIEKAQRFLRIIQWFQLKKNEPSNTLTDNKEKDNKKGKKFPNDIVKNGLTENNINSNNKRNENNKDMNTFKINIQKNSNNIQSNQDNITNNDKDIENDNNSIDMPKRLLESKILNKNIQKEGNYVLQPCNNLENSNIMVGCRNDENLNDEIKINIINDIINQNENKNGSQITIIPPKKNASLEKEIIKYNVNISPIIQTEKENAIKGVIPNLNSDNLSLMTHDKLIEKENPKNIENKNIINKELDKNNGELEESEIKNKKNTIFKLIQKENAYNKEMDDNKLKDLKEKGREDKKIESAKQTEDNNVKLTKIEEKDLIFKFNTKIIEYTKKEHKSILKEILRELLLVPRIDFLTEEKLFKINDFELLQKKNINPVFLRNLFNSIEIINFIWIATKKVIDNFHKILEDIGFLLRYNFRNEKNTNEGIDYVLETPVPIMIYSYISKYGLNAFNKSDIIYLDFQKDFFYAKNQIGLIYQETSRSYLISNLINLGKDNIILCPNIMYYINKNVCKFLFNKGIFIKPKKYNSISNLTVNNDKFYGFNELDFSFILLKPLTIKEDNNFNMIQNIDNSSTIKDFDILQKTEITFPENINIFIEYKSNLKEKNFNLGQELELLHKKANRFHKSFSNSVYGKNDNKYGREEFKSYFIYDNNRDDIKSGVNQELNKYSSTIIYNSPSLQFVTIVDLRNNIRILNNKIENIEETNEKKLNKLTTEIKKLKEEIKDLKEKNYNEKEKDDSTKIIIELFMDKLNLDVFDDFKKDNENMILLSKIGEKEKLIQIANIIIGKKIQENEDKILYGEFLDLLEDEINKVTVASDYFKAFKSILFGKNEIIKMKEFGFFVKHELTANVVKNILKFIMLLRMMPFKISIFQRAVLYYLKTVCLEINKNSEAEYVLAFRGKSIKECVIIFIKYFNQKNILVC